MRQLAKLDDVAVERELRQLWRDSQAHRSSIQTSGEITERLGRRVQTLERLLEERDALERILGMATR